MADDQQSLTAVEIPSSVRRILAVVIELVERDGHDAGAIASMLIGMGLGMYHDGGAARAEVEMHARVLIGQIYGPIPAALRAAADKLDAEVRAQRQQFAYTRLLQPTPPPEPGAGTRLAELDEQIRGPIRHALHEGNTHTNVREVVFLLTRMLAEISGRAFVTGQLAAAFDLAERAPVRPTE